MSKGVVMCRSCTCIVVLTTVLTVAATPVCGGDLPDLAQSIITFTGYEGADTLVLLVLPDGSGPGYEGAFMMNTGLVVDATLEMTIIDPMGYPIILYPAEDVWLESAGGGTLATCSVPSPGIILADPVASDMQGRCFFSVPPVAGGWSDGVTQGFINGEALQSSAGVLVRFVSPDIDGNLVVNLSDAGFFATDLFGTYHLRSDFNADGVVDLSDSGFLATSIGKGCPQ